MAQDDLNSFLAVAEDLRVKGLTQGSGSADNSTSKQKSEPTKYPPPVRPRESQMPSEPPSKKSRAAPPEVASYDDDIQEVLPVKSEPGAAPTAGASHYDTQDQNQVALEEQYDESYDYGQYGEAYDDGSGMIDPNTGLPLQTADGNKGESSFYLFLLRLCLAFNGRLYISMTVNVQCLALNGRLYISIQCSMTVNV